MELGSAAWPLPYVTAIRPCSITIVTSLPMAPTVFPLLIDVDWTRFTKFHDIERVLNNHSLVLYLFFPISIRFTNGNAMEIDNFVNTTTWQSLTSSIRVFVCSWPSTRKRRHEETTGRSAPGKSWRTHTARQRSCVIDVFNQRLVGSQR